MDQKRKQDYTNYFNSHLGIVEKYRNKFEESVERADLPNAIDIIPMQCDCPTHACEELCIKDCDNESWNKGLRKVRPQ